MLEWLLLVYRVENHELVPLKTKRLYPSVEMCRLDAKFVTVPGQFDAICELHVASQPKTLEEIIQRGEPQCGNYDITLACWRAKIEYCKAASALSNLGMPAKRCTTESLSE